MSADTVEQVARFHEKNHLNFTLLADPDRKVIDAYGTKMPVFHVSKRWTFIIGPDLVIRSHRQGRRSDEGRGQGGKKRNPAAQRRSSYIATLTPNDQRRLPRDW